MKNCCMDSTENFLTRNRLNFGQNTTDAKIIDALRVHGLHIQI